MSIGTAIFDTALIGYPLYLTSKNITAEKTENTHSEELTQLMRFWFVFSGLSVAEGFGVSTIPGYYFLKGILMISLYSDLHSKVVNEMVLTRLCKQYLSVSERAVLWWDQKAVPQVEEIDRRAGGWLSTAKSYLSGWVGFGNTTIKKEE